MTLYVVQARSTSPFALERARFVRQGFSGPAFVFSWLWLLFHRCWIAALLVLLLEIAFIVLAVLHLTPTAAIAVFLLERVFLGLEGNNLRLRRDAGFNDIVEARDRDEAETIFFRRAFGEPRS